jgi:hypothetical protein
MHGTCKLEKERTALDLAPFLISESSLRSLAKADIP